MEMRVVQFVLILKHGYVDVVTMTKCSVSQANQKR
jgi:hypothetical protein